MRCRICCQGQSEQHVFRQAGIGSGEEKAGLKRFENSNKLLSREHGDKLTLEAAAGNKIPGADLRICCAGAGPAELSRSRKQRDRQER
jgi:hypothetical protein